MEQDRVRRFEQAAELLPPRLRRLAMELPDARKERAEELRLRVRTPLTVLTPEGELSVADDAPVTADDLERVVAGVTEYSRYASAEALRQGFLPVRGGFRIGVCGTAVLRDGAVCGVKDFSSLAIRIVRERVGLGAALAPRLFDGAGRFRSTLILSPPGGGKTTLLRDLIRCLSLGSGTHRALRVAVIDERSELAVSCQGVPQTELGNHTDVLDGCPKALGIPMVLRAMSPQVIAVDEIASREDVAAMCAAANCGVGLLATIHALGVAELARKPLWRELLAAGVFERAVVIGNDGGTRAYAVEDVPCSAGSARD
ncbi:MAG: stage III sporulation protein AA [Oscillospiraceae bacterium]|nr:stage III sporulation protein AA [Oscillospiraceae bacterium]